MSEENLLPALITLTTDFGSTDGFVGIVKAVILSIARGVQIVDISHEVKPWDIASAAWILKTSYSYFPAKTVHVAVVDPGVGGDRRSLIVATTAGTFVGPDNGLFSFLYSQQIDIKAYELTDDRYWLSPVSSTFHARDIYAPVAAHLAAGVVPKVLGNEIGVDSLVRLPAPKLMTTRDGIHGQVEYVDRFGNLITNIPANLAPAAATFFVEDKPAGEIKSFYGSAAAGAPAVVAGSHGFIEIGVSLGRACDYFSCGTGAAVFVKRPPDMKQ